MVRRNWLRTIILAVCLLPPGAARANNPLASLPGDSFCFSRVYDAPHLKRHPAQRTTSTLASIQHDKTTGGAWLRMQLRQKGRAKAANVVAGCEWSATANRDTSGNRLLSAYSGEEGFVCIAIYNQQSAEEAGAVVFNVTADGGALTVYFDDAIGLWETPEPDTMLKLHREDRAFRLNRADAGQCAAMDQALRPE
jgi:hypothetical protein